MTDSQKGALALFARLEKITIRDNELFYYFNLAKNPVDRKLIAERISEKIELKEIIRKAGEQLVDVYLSMDDKTKKGLRDIFEEEYRYNNDILFEIADRGSAKDKQDVASLHKLFSDYRFPSLYHSLSEDKGKGDIRNMLIIKDVGQLISLASLGSEEDKHFVIMGVFNTEEPKNKLYKSYRCDGFSTLLQTVTEAARSEVIQILIRDLPASKERLMDVINDPHFDQSATLVIVNDLLDLSVIDKTIATFDSESIERLYTIARPKERERLLENLMTKKDDAMHIQHISSILRSPAMDPEIASNIAEKVIGSASEPGMNQNILADLVPFLRDEQQDTTIPD